MRKIVTICVCLALAGALALGWFLFGGRLLAWYYDMASDSAREAGRAGEAAAALENELAMYPRDESLRLRVVELYIEDGNYSRAEYHLVKGLREVGPSAGLYAKLCSVYVAQDKLMDAVALLDGIKNEKIFDEISERRPAPPVFAPAPGTYEGALTVEIELPEGCAGYVSWTGDIPSVKKDLYGGPAPLGAGSFLVKAVAVDADGLVSAWADAEYSLENVVEPIVFADAKIEALIRAAAGKPDGMIFSSDLWGIEALRADEPAEYSTLADLAWCTGLNSLYLAGADTACDISALPALSGLRELTLRDFHIDSVDLESVGRVTSLEKLDLSGNRISGLDALSGLTNLTELNLSANNLLEVAALSSLTNLKKLDISLGAVQDLRPLAPLTGLEEINLSQNRVTALTGLETMSRLRRIDASYNYVDTIAPISKLPALEELLLGHNALDDIPSLGQLSALRALDLSFNRLESISALTGLAALETLYINENRLSSLEGAAGLVSLVTLDVSKNSVKSVDPLKSLDGLVTLRIEHNSVATLLPLKSCKSLKTVYAFGNPLTDPLDAFVGTGITVNRG